MDKENQDQIALRSWLAAGLQIPEVVALHGDSGYLLNNMIAKYTLAADSYPVSTLALDEFRRRRVDLTQTWSRSRFYGRDKPFKFEHVVPAGIVRERLLKSGRTAGTVRHVLQNLGFVAVVLRSEDQKLRDAGLNGKMPDGWSWGDDPLDRYRAVGIEMSDQVLKVKGAIMR